MVILTITGKVYFVLIVAYETYKYFDARARKINAKSRLGEAIRYVPSSWDGLSRFIDDGRIDPSKNSLARAIWRWALGPRNALFAGSKEGGDIRAVSPCLSNASS